MEEKSDCEKCRTWEEEMYWKHFNFMHFYQILPKNFHDHLVLPEKFSTHMMTQVPEKVSLIGPSGTVTDIEIQKTDNLLLVGDGWKDFVRTYELEENSLLIFKYKQNSSFEVLIFDQGSFCEKEASYFVKKCTHTKFERENHKKRSVREDSSTELVEDEEDDGSAFVASKKSRKDAAGEVNGLGCEENTPNPRSQISNAAVKRKRGRPRRTVLSYNSLGKSKAQPKEKPSINEVNPEQIHTSLRDMTTPGNGVNIPLENQADKSKDQSDKSLTGNGTAQELSPISGGDWSTPEDGEDFSEINNPHKLKSLSGKEPSENETAKNMHHISTRGQIVLNYKESSPTADVSDNPRKKRGRPKKAANPICASSGKGYPEYISSRTMTEKEKEEALHKASLEKTENSFIVVMRPTCVYRRFYMSIPAEWMNKNLSLQHQEFILRVGDKTWQTMFYFNGKRGVGGLCRGWKKFALENLLEEFDVLLFKLANPNKNETIIFDVEIFRVIPLTPPPLHVSSSILT